MIRVLLRVVPLALLLALFAYSPERAVAKEPAVNELVNAFKKALRSKDPKTRSRAFDFLREAYSPFAVEELIKGVKAVQAEGVKIRKAQKDTEALYEKQITLMNEAQADFDASERNGKDMKRFNNKERVISKVRDKCIMQLKNLENDFTRNRAMEQQAVMVVGEILDGLEEEQLREVLGLLDAKWLQSKDVKDRLRWVSAISDLKRPEAAASLNAVAANEAMPSRVRLAAIDTLADRGDGTMMGRAIKMLELPTDEFLFIVAAIGVLTRLHDRRAIDPLIRFLGRTDLKREREDGHKALMSLTGLDHGPYPGEWKKWWDENRKSFVLPKGPRAAGLEKKAEKGGTFYGIHTFSDRVLFIVDISGSMDRQQKGKGAKGRTKWEVCRDELTGFIYNLDDGNTFNVVFFNHQIIPWQAKKVVASNKTKKMLKKWVEKQVPLGGTNISDALNFGFTIATRVTGRPALDTIFFLTDGVPTAGRFQNPKKILELMREWNETAKLTIHCVGIGKDCDDDFLRELAKIGNGEYQKR